MDTLRSAVDEYLAMRRVLGFALRDVGYRLRSFVVFAETEGAEFVTTALALDRDDVDLRAGVLTIRRTKFGKSRYVPIHATTRRALRRYARRRDQVFPSLQTPAFLVSERRARVTQSVARWTFVKLSHQIGLRGPADRRGPRLHDFRHGFALQTLIRWYRSGVDVERYLPRLSTYLGHVHVADTYWYLSATPELLRLASRRLDEPEEGGLS